MPRKTETPQNAESLRKIAERLNECSAQVAAVAEMIEVKGLGTLNVANYPSLVLGIKNVEAFAGAARLALLETIETRGDFRAADAQAGKPRAKKGG